MAQSPNTTSDASHALKWTHDATDPLTVTLELSRPFPRESLEVREGLTYIKYPDMIRRLIRATGNRFSTKLVGHETMPAGTTKSGQTKLLIRVWVELDIPALGSSRVHEGVQVAYPESNKGEDMFKGAISDAIKKAAQSYGVGIELTGVDAEWIVNQRNEQVDRDTGEIQEASQPQRAPRQIVPPKDDAERAMRRIHAAASSAGITGAHDVLHAWAAENGYTSLRDVPTANLDRMAEAFEDRPEGARRWAETYRKPAAPPVPRLSDEEAVDAALANTTPVTAGQLHGMDDPELDRNIERIAEMARS